MEKKVYLTDVGETRLDAYEEIKNKSDESKSAAIEQNNTFVVNSKETVDIANIEIYIDNFIANMEDYSNNVFYDEIINNEDIIRDFYFTFKNNGIISDKNVVEIFAKYNNYIMLDDLKLKNDMQELIKIANRTFMTLRTNTVKAEENAKRRKKKGASK